MSEEKEDVTVSAGQKSYNTTDLAADLSGQFGLSKAQALRIVAAVFTLVGNAAARKEVVRIHSFGNFKALATSERRGRNPKTGEETVILASTRPHFVASQNLKVKVKDGSQEALEAPEVVTSTPQALAANKPAVDATPKAQRPAQPKTAAPAQKRQPVARPQAAAPAPLPEVEEIEADGQSAIDEL